MEKDKTTTKTVKAKKPAKKIVKPKAEVKTEIVDKIVEKPEIELTEEKDESAEAVVFDEAGVDEKNKKNKRYFEATGRRKSSVARVRLFTIKPFEEDEGKITVNEKFYKQYFPTLELQQIAEAALRRLKSLNRFEVVAKVNGGGMKSQSEAVRHGMARVLVEFNADFRKKLKKAGYLKRDPRVKERKKYGLKKARKSPQWAKR